MIGSVVVWLSFAAALVSAITYLQSATKRRNAVKIARTSFAISAASVFAASVLLMLYVLRHQFEYAYVWNYSSRDLPLYLLITSFWAGQEGSFLLWALYSSVIGLLLGSFARKKHIEYEVMTVYALLHAFLLLLLVVKSPFTMLWNEFPGQVTAATVPMDGRGLNPLLQNMWMAIHPPILFVGFAAMAAPFAFAVVALWRKLYNDWVMYALPWVLFGIVSLGAGIMLGGYWAYGVLGWGGWWGWDPVENSSLIPWMVGLVLVHTILVQKNTGGLKRTNLLMGLLAYVLVVYSTFLTRSGILGQASVHSFVDPGAIAYALLIVWIGSAVIGSAVLLVKRWKNIQPRPMGTNVFKRETILSVTAAILGLTTLVIFFGTNWPIIAKASLEPSFYNKTNLPFAVVLAFLLGFSLYVRWQEDSRKEFLKRAALAISASLLATILLVVIGVREVQVLVLGLVSFFAFFANLEVLMRIVRQDYRHMGGPMAHIGMALLLFGILGSGFYGEKKTVSLPQNSPKEVLGYTLTYEKAEPTPDGKWKFFVNAERNGARFTVAPVMFESSYNNSTMRNPDYVSFLTKDFYIEPVSLEKSEPQQPVGQNIIDIEKGQSVTIGGMTVKFVRFDLAAHGVQNVAEGMPIGAVLEVTQGKTVKEVVPVTVFRQGKTPEFRSAMLNDDVGFQLVTMNIDMQTKRSTVKINVLGVGDNSPKAQPTDILVVEASVKPLISLVWIGSVLMVAGALMAMVRRRNGWGQVAATTAAVAPPTVKEETRHVSQEETMVK